MSSDGAFALEPTGCFRDSEKWPFKILERDGSFALSKEVDALS